MPETNYTIDLKIKDDGGVTWMLFGRDEIGALKVVKAGMAASLDQALVHARDAVREEMVRKAVKP